MASPVLPVRAPPRLGRVTDATGRREHTAGRCYSGWRYRSFRCVHRREWVASPTRPVGVGTLPVHVTEAVGARTGEAGFCCEGALRVALLRRLLLLHLPE